MDGAIERIEFMARSPIRVRILTELQNEGSLTKQELRDRVNGTRTTVHRNLEALCERNWIEKGGRGYAITLGGEAVADNFVDLAEIVQVEQRLQPFLKWVDRSNFDIDLQLLAGAEIVVAEPGDPWAMVNKHVQALRKMNSAQITLPLTGLHAMEVLCDRVVREDAQCEVVVVPDVAETFQSNPDYAKLFEEMGTTDRFTAYVYNESLPYYLGILDDAVQIGVDEEGEPRALIETDSEEVREWAEGKYEQWKQQAEEMP